MGGRTRARRLSSVPAPVFDPALLARPGTVLLDTARTDSENRRSFCFTGPRDVLTAHTPSGVDDLLAALDDATARGRYVAGYLSYEAGYAAVDLDLPPQARSEHRGTAPLAWFGVYDRAHVLAPPEVDAGLAVLDGDAAVREARLGIEREAYEAAIRTVRDHIREGNVYQINYTAPLRFSVDGDPRVLYRRLRARQHVPYGAYLNTGERQILSCSPELFLRRTGEQVVTRPMKGTIRRGRTLEEDEALRRDLAADPKNRAENLMIVDLLRNDLSVCCRPGSVEVPALYETEPFDTVTQMTSTVQGRLQSGTPMSELMRAMFPCGSVTGAPKRRAMSVIGELEPNPRGVYCGAIGYAGPDDTAVFNVAIRTAVLRDGQGTMGVGSGIVWDSEPSAEYEEGQLKGQFLTDPLPARASAAAREADATAERRRRAATTDDLRLIETMRFDGVTVPLLTRHLQRLERSAQYFGFPMDPDRVRRRVRAMIRQHDLETLQKVRLTLDRWGRLHLETTPLERANDAPWRLIWADERVDSSNRFLYHKTTQRGVYERAAAQAADEGADEAILVNERGEVTEGARSNLFVQIGDRYWTPPVSSGLLAGVYREHILDTHPDAGERVLTPDDLRTADGIFCCNGVRGWRPATLMSAEPDLASPESTAA